MMDGFLTVIGDLHLFAGFLSLSRLILKTLSGTSSPLPHFLLLVFRLVTFFTRRRFTFSVVRYFDLPE